MTDNLDGLDIFAVPEPVTLVLVVFALPVLLAAGGRPRQSFATVPVRSR